MADQDFFADAGFGHGFNISDAHGLNLRNGRHSVSLHLALLGVHAVSNGSAGNGAEHAANGCPCGSMVPRVVANQCARARAERASRERARGSVVRPSLWRLATDERRHDGAAQDAQCKILHGSNSFCSFGSAVESSTTRFNLPVISRQTSVVSTRLERIAHVDPHFIHSVRLTLLRFTLSTSYSC